MNTGAVAQPPIAAGEATADRSRSAGRKDGSGKQGEGFAGLLSKLTNRSERDDREVAAPKDAGSNGGDNRLLAEWLQSCADAAGEDGHAADLEQALTSQGGEGNGSTDVDINALMQLLSASGAMAGANGLAAIAGRVANGTMTEAETAMMQAALAAQEDGDVLSPEQLILASLAKAAGRAGEPDSDAKPTTAVLTVLRRETHLAPVAEGGVEWAAHVALEGGRVRRADAQLDNSGDIQLLHAADGSAGTEDTHLANPQAAVTAARDGQLSDDWRRGASPIAEMQAAADARSGAVEQVSAAGRSDALVNTGLASPLVQQVANRIATEASTLTDQVTQTARPDAPAFGVKHESAVKVMHIQLQPADLGVVTIRMSVKNNALRLDLETGRGETAHLIQRERESLSALLRSAGYVIDGMDVRVATPGAAQTADSQTNLMPGGGQPGSSQPEARSSGERPQHERRNNALGNGRHGEDEQAGPAARNGGVYI